MNSNAKTDILYLAAAGLVLLLVNAAVVMGARGGMIAPLDSSVLWGSFAVLNVCALLWAAGMLGLQPLVMAFSYAAGGLLAYQGVRFLPELNVAGIISAGAVYSAFGCMLLTNAATGERMAFFTKRQAPYVYIIIALLLLNGLLLSRLPEAGWSVFSRAAVFPFLFSGAGVGAAWLVSCRCVAARKNAAGRRMETPAQEADADQPVEPSAVEEEDEEAGGLLFAVPGESDLSESVEEALPDCETEAPETAEPQRKQQEAASAAAAEEEAFPEDFYPLEIDNGNDVEVQENPDLLGVAAMVAESAPRPADEAEPVIDDTLTSYPEVSSVRNADSEPDAEPVNQTIEEDQAGADDWLSSHLNLLSKLEKKAIQE